LNESKKRGVGSSKVIYESGVKPFDSLLRGMDTETAFPLVLNCKNFDCTNEYQSANSVALVYESAEIEAINFTAYPVILRRGISC
jgi:hypothetical protein